VIADNLSNSSPEVLNRIEFICGKRPEFIQIDITDEVALDRLFNAHPDIDSVIHFAALKVGKCPAPCLRYSDFITQGISRLVSDLARRCFPATSELAKAPVFL
jgi:UDP-glucose 4-epimerase